MGLEEEGQWTRGDDGGGGVGEKSFIFSSFFFFLAAHSPSSPCWGALFVLGSTVCYLCFDLFSWKHCLYSYFVFLALFYMNLVCCFLFALGLRGVVCMILCFLCKKHQICPFFDPSRKIKCSIPCFYN